MGSRLQPIWSLLQPCETGSSNHALNFAQKQNPTQYQAWDMISILKFDCYTITDLNAFKNGQEVKPDEPAKVVTK